MARERNKLNAKQAATLATPGRHSDGGGLYLVIDGEGSNMRRRWLYLFHWRGKRREMGLGSAAVISKSKNEIATPLADARRLRDEAERLVREGRDPIAERDQARSALARKPTFGEVADALIESKSSEWRNEKHLAQWKATLKTHAGPLRSRPVDEIDTAAVLEVLKPLWAATPETASRLRGRIEAVLDAAKAQGHRTGENPAAWRGHLSHLLPKRQKLSRGHHAALPYADVPAFVAQLRDREGVAAMALEFTILTATRSGEVRGATWREIDIEKKVWTVPAIRMKAGREHRIPLSVRVLAVLEAVKPLAGNDEDALLFPGARGGRPLSDMSLTAVLRRMGLDDLTVHGFRSAFRDWAGNETHFAREIAEAALAHVIGDKAEQAYRRGDALEKRRELMNAWASWCEPRQGDNVLKFTKSGGNPAV